MSPKHRILRWSTYFGGRDPQRIPLYPWQDAPQEGGIVLHILPRQLGITEVERKGER